MTHDNPIRHHCRANPGSGFTVIEIVVVIVLISVLAALALPRFLSTSVQARVAVLQNLAGAMQTTVSLVQAQARLAGMKPVASNPGGSSQTGFVLTTEAGRSELDWRNLCPESSAEVADALDMPDYMQLMLPDGMDMSVDNRFTRIGYAISNSTTSGCYVLYDSFGDPECTITVVSADC